MSMATQDQHNHESQPSSQTRAVRQALASMESRVVGQSAAIREVATTLAELAASRLPALLVGEPGTGKRFFARMLHDTAAHGPLIQIAEADAPITTDALRRAAESAHGGTLLIVGIDRLDPSLQDELVAIVHSGAARLVGSAEGRCSAALAELFASSTLTLPTLNERAEDLPQLVQHFFELHATRTRRTDLRGVSPEAMAQLAAHVFVDHVRGLDRAINHAVAFAEGPFVTAADLPEEIRGPKQPIAPLLLGSLPAQGIDLRGAVEEFETRMILQALERTGWNKNRASRLLGLNRTTLVEMIKRKRLAPPLVHHKPSTLAEASSDLHGPHAAIESTTASHP